jgi:putative ATP-binding cassette transporter
LLEVLKAVGLPQLEPLLDVQPNDSATLNWAQRLSGGEQQRLAIARALLLKPAWLFLDEATSNLDETAERTLYGLLRDRLTATTLISIAHRPAVAAFHHQVLEVVRPQAGEIAHLTLMPLVGHEKGSA